MMCWYMVESALLYTCTWSRFMFEVQSDSANVEFVPVLKC